MTKLVLSAISPERPAGSPCGHRAHPAGHDHAGGEIVQAVRALDPTIPILLNSGYTSNGVVKQMLAEDSVQGFLGKPYDLDQLLNTINQLMKRT